MNTKWLYRDGYVIATRNQKELKMWGSPPDRGQEFVNALNTSEALSNMFLAGWPTAWLLEE